MWRQALDLTQFGFNAVEALVKFCLERKALLKTHGGHALASRIKGQLRGLPYGFEIFFHFIRFENIRVLQDVIETDRFFDSCRCPHRLQQISVGHNGFCVYPNGQFIGSWVGDLGESGDSATRKGLFDNPLDIGFVRVERFR